MKLQEKYTQSRICKELNLCTSSATKLLRAYVDEFPNRSRIMTREEADVFKAWLARRVLKKYNLEYLLKEGN